MLTQTIVLYSSALACHLLSLSALWRSWRAAPAAALALALASGLLAARVCFPAWRATQTGLYDLTDAVLSLAAGLALVTAALALGRR